MFETNISFNLYLAAIVFPHGAGIPMFLLLPKRKCCSKGFPCYKIIDSCFGPGSVNHPSRVMAADPYSEFTDSRVGEPPDEASFAKLNKNFLHFVRTKCPNTGLW